MTPRGLMGQTVKFATPAETAIFREDYVAPQYMEQWFAQDIKRISYDTEAYDWEGQIRALLVSKGIAEKSQLEGLRSLSDLHTILGEEWTRLDESELNRVSVAFFENGEAFERLYKRFVKEVVAAHCPEPVYWQTTPTIRFHFPNQQGFTWKVRYHSDIMLGHPPHEINVWVPLTRVYGTNSMCLAPRDPSVALLKRLDLDLEDFATRVQYDDELAAECARLAPPLELEYGEYVMFDPRCLHAGQHNQTEHTRISFDMRVLPQSALARMRIEYRGTGRRRMLFAPGHYYDSLLASEL